MPFNIPLPNAPAGSFMEGVKEANALSASDIQNYIKKIEAQYAPYNKYADAASKLAYSQFVGPQSIAAILNNPATRGMFTPEQYNQLSSAFTSQVKNPAFALQNLPVPKRQSSIFDGLLNLFKEEQPQNAFARQPMPMGRDEIINSSAIGAGMNNNIVPISAQTSGHSTGYNQNPLSGTSPSYERASSQLPGGVYGAASPSSVTNAGEAGLKAQSEAEAKAITDQWKERQDDIRTQSAGAIEMENQLARLKALRSELGTLEKGFPFGHLPGITSAAQESGLVENNLVAARLKAWQSNRITNMDIGFGKGMKPGRWMNDDAFDNEVNYEEALSKRLQEYSVFDNAAQSMGLPPAKADAIWIRYANEKPFFDPKTKQPINENLETWEEYLTPESIKQTFSPSYKKQMNNYKENMAGANPQKDKQIQKQYSGFNAKSRGAELLAKKMQMPKFNNKQDFLNWYNSQDEFVKHAVRIKLGEK